MGERGAEREEQGQRGERRLRQGVLREGGEGAAGDLRHHLGALGRKLDQAGHERRVQGLLPEDEADYYRYIAEFSDGDKKAAAAENARVAYQDAATVAEKDLAVTHPIRLGLALNYSVLMYEVLSNQ